LRISDCAVARVRLPISRKQGFVETSATMLANDAMSAALLDRCYILTRRVSARPVQLI
jgi:hypothetical protein